MRSKGADGPEAGEGAGYSSGGGGGADYTPTGTVGGGEGEEGGGVDAPPNKPNSDMMAERREKSPLAPS